MKLISIKSSTRKDKKYVATFTDKKIHFGQKGSKTYIDSASEAKKQAYIDRHKVNEDWSKINPGSLSRFILWGPSKSINNNIKSYKKKFNLQ